MSAIHKILVCSDFSSNSIKALKAARNFALLSQAEVLVLHVAHTAYYMDAWGLESWISEDMRNEILVKLDDMLKEQIKDIGLKAKTKVTHNSSITKSVLNIIDEYKPDIVFIGHKGMTGMERVLIGSVARKIATMSPVPVMVIKSEEPLKKVAALVDGAEESSQVIETAMDYSKRFHAEMSVVSLVPSISGIYSTVAGNYTDTLIRALKEKLKESIPEISNRIKSKLGDHKAEVIVSMSCERDLSFHLKEIIEDHDVDLAVLRKRSSSKLEQLILGSVSLRILELFKGNVLVLH